MFKDFNNNPQAKFVNIDSPLNSVNLVLPTTKPGEGTTDKKVVLDSMFEGALAFNSLNDTTTTGFYELVLSLTSIDTSNAVSMNSMFKNACIYNSEGSYSYGELGFIEKLVRPVIDVTGGNINKVDDMSHMFDNAFPHDDKVLSMDALTTLYRSQLGKLKLWGSADDQKTAENCDGSYMFSKVGVQEINLENVNFVNISDYSFMFSFFGFYEHPGVIEPLEDLSMANATSVRGIFYEAYFNYNDWEEEGFKLDLSD
ncbi:MAG: BspA family leucine-rich repeat surface protein [Coriobacteriia bacterium]|nr:BspA family leucine-rich repeat surface protein [Coriobacteriia bacterium]